MLADSNAKRAAVIETFTKRVGRKDEPEVQEARDAHKEARIAIPTPMLDVIFQDGRIVSFNYSYLRRVDFNPGDTLTLKFTDGVRVIIEGRNLRRLRQQIRLHRADEILEGSELEEAVKADDEPHIIRIEITTAED
jgi:hypothetical protein